MRAIGIGRGKRQSLGNLSVQLMKTATRVQIGYRYAEICRGVISLKMQSLAATFPNTLENPTNVSQFG